MWQSATTLVTPPRPSAAFLRVQTAMTQPGRLSRRWASPRPGGTLEPSAGLAGLAKTRGHGRSCCAAVLWLVYWPLGTLGTWRQAFPGRQQRPWPRTRFRRGACRLLLSLLITGCSTRSDILCRTFSFGSGTPQARKSEVGSRSGAKVSQLVTVPSTRQRFTVR